MTELLYLADSDAGYVREFRARVIARPPGAVVLDRTYFYPAGGGQPGDRGMLRAEGGAPVPVVDVAKSGGVVLHRLGRSSSSSGAAALAPGVEVAGEVDWQRRHQHMRLHTAQHLVSAVIFDRWGIRTRRATMAGQGGSIDLERPLPEGETLDQLSESVRSYLSPPRAVRIAHVPRPEWERAPAARSGLVPLAPEVDPVRVIEIEGIDRCPCGGTHVRSTGELGEVGYGPTSPLESGGWRLAFTLRGTAPPTLPG